MNKQYSFMRAHASARMQTIIICLNWKTAKICKVAPTFSTLLVIVFQGLREKRWKLPFCYTFCYRLTLFY